MQKHFIFGLFFFLGFFSKAQESKFSVYLLPQVGFNQTKIEDDKQYSFSSGIDVYTAYKLNTLNIETGLGYRHHQSDDLEIQTLHIPLGINTVLNFTKNNEDSLQQPLFGLAIGLGIYASHLLEYETEILKEKNMGWNFGAYGRGGLMIVPKNAMKIGVGLQRFQDFSYIKENNYKLKQTNNSVYLALGFDL